MARLDYSSDELLAEGQNGSGDLYYQLGVMHAVGRTVAVDLVIAHKWFNLAAHRGNAEAARRRQELATEMTAAEIAAAQRAAREWLAAGR